MIIEKGGKINKKNIKDIICDDGVNVVITSEVSVLENILTKVSVFIKDKEFGKTVIALHGCIQYNNMVTRSYMTEVALLETVPKNIGYPLIAYVEEYEKGKRKYTITSKTVVIYYDQEYEPNPHPNRV